MELWGNPQFFVFEEHTVNRNMPFYIVVKAIKIIEIAMKVLDLTDTIDEILTNTSIETLDISGSEVYRFPLDLEDLPNLKKLNLSNCWTDDNTFVRLPSSLLELFISSNYIHNTLFLIY